MNRTKLNVNAVMLIVGLVWSVSIKAQSLPAVTGVAYDGQQITWNAVDGATGYNLHIDSDYFTTVGDVTTYTPELSGKYYVVAYNNQGLYSPLEVIDSDVVPTSNSVEVQLVAEPNTPEPEVTDGQLERVNGAYYDGSVITWDALPGATGYNIHLGYDYLTTVGDTLSYKPETTGDYFIIGYDDAGNYSPAQVIVDNTTNGENFVRVSALGEPSQAVQPPSAPNGLGAVTNVSYDGEKITWNDIFYAAGFNVHYFFEGSTGWTYLDTVGKVTSYVPQMTGSYLIVGFDSAGNFSPFQVVEGDKVVSTNSVTINTLGEGTVRPPQGLPTVSGVAYDGQTITWNAVDGAVGYNIHIDNFEYLTSVGNVTSFEPAVSGKYYIVAFDGQGNYSPIQVIDSDVVPTSNSVDVRK